MYQTLICRISMYFTPSICVSAGFAGAGFEGVVTPDVVFCRCCTGFCVLSVNIFRFFIYIR